MPTFDWNINLGQALAFVSMLLAGVVGYVNLERDVQDLARESIAVRAVTMVNASAIEVNRNRVGQAEGANIRLTSQMESLDELLGEVRDELRTINRRSVP